MDSAVILSKINDTGVDEMEIAVDLGLSMPEIKQQLNQLKNNGLIEDDNNGKWKRSPVDESELRRLEQKVQGAFYEAGKALAEIRDRELYRGQYGTFEIYCQEVFGFSRQYAYNQVDAAVIVDDLSTICLQKSLPLPNRESLCRPLKPLPPNERVSAWELACDLAEEKVPTARQVKEAIGALKPKEPIAPWKAGDICIIETTNDDTKGRRGRWVTVLRANTYTCEIADFTGDPVVVRHDDLKEFPLTDRSNADFMRKVLYRLQALHKANEPAYFPLIKAIGTRQSDWLSSVEEQLLEAMELIEMKKNSQIFEMTTEASDAGNQET